MKTTGYAAFDSQTPLRPYDFERRNIRADDVLMEVLYSGVCHSDLHWARNDWGWSSYPVVPGHEIVGRVLEVGEGVQSYKAGDFVAVGCLVDSCKQCDRCSVGSEHQCREGATGTYGSKDRLTGELTQGGYAKHLVVSEHFLLSIPGSMELSKAAPLLCAGITTYSPLRKWNVGKGTRVGVLGLGGLGHMAVKLAVGMGAEVTVVSRSAHKVADAKLLGAHKVLVSSNAAEMTAAANGFDVIIDTIPVKHDVAAYIPLLDNHGVLVVVGHLGTLDEMSSVPLVLGGRIIAGSNIGGIAETQEMLNFCAEKKIHPECEMIEMSEINEAFDRMERSDVKYRFVIDMKNLAPSV